MNTTLTTRTSVFDAKFCLLREEECSKKIQEEFENSTFISFDELGEFAQTIKITDEDKPNYDIIELSFLITNRYRYPLVMERGDARALKRGSSILFSFTPTHLGPSTAVTSPDDLLPILKKNYHIYENSNPEIKLIGIAHNVNTKIIESGIQKDINYYFLIFEAHFADYTHAPIQSREHDDVTLDHIEWKGRIDGPEKNLVVSLLKKPVDRMIMDHVYNTYDPVFSQYQKARFIPETEDGSLGARLFHRYDVFISHASEDKHFVTPLATSLETQHNLKVWYDNAILTEGDKLREVIKKGINTSRYGIIVFSEHFFRKRWPYIELEYIIKVVHERKRNVIIPVWYGIKPGEFSHNFEKYATEKIRQYCSSDSNPDDILSMYRSLEDILGITECTTDPEAVAQVIAYRIKSDRKPV